MATSANPGARRPERGWYRARVTRPDLAPRALAPYFVVAALVHAGAVATRFDVLAAQLPAGMPLAIMLAQFPLLVLSGYFEGRLDHGERRRSMPLWMRIGSTPVKLAFAFGFMYLVVVAAQTWDVSIGPADPTPPLTWPTAQRALWFGMFTLGFVMLFYMAAAALLVPVLRVLTAPLRRLPVLAGGVLAVVLGGGLGIVVLAAVQSTKLAAFVAGIRATVAAEPGLVIGVTLVAALGPLLVGSVLARQE